jgi:hypothetical protein
MRSRRNISTSVAEYPKLRASRRCARRAWEPPYEPRRNSATFRSPNMGDPPELGILRVNHELLVKHLGVGEELAVRIDRPARYSRLVQTLDPVLRRRGPQGDSNLLLHRHPAYSGHRDRSSERSDARVIVSSLVAPRKRYPFQFTTSPRAGWGWRSSTWNWDTDRLRVGKHTVDLIVDNMRVDPTRPARSRKASSSWPRARIRSRRRSRSAGRTRSSRRTRWSAPASTPSGSASRSCTTRRTRRPPSSPAAYITATGHGRAPALLEGW